MIDQARDELARDPIIWWNLAGASVGAVRADPGGEPRRRRHARHPRSAHAPGERDERAPARGRATSSSSFPGEARRARASSTACRFSIARGRGARAGRRVGLRQVDDGARRSCASCRSPAASSRQPHRASRAATCSSLPVTEMRAVRGAEIAMIFQEPMTSLNPVQTVGAQVVEAIRLHETVARRGARARVRRAVRARRHPRPDARFDAYPHQLSGGLKQRVMIAMALADAAEAPDRRRADHRARRDDPGADPGAAARPPATTGHGDPAHHATTSAS